MKLLRRLRDDWLWLLAAVIMAGIIHIGAVLGLPMMENARSVKRLDTLLPLHDMVVLPPVTEEAQALPYMSPEIAYAFCRYDLSAGPVEIRTALPDSAWSIALIDTLGANFFSISGADLQRREVELILAPTEESELGVLPLPKESSASSITVSVAKPRGIAAILAPALGTGYAEETAKALAAASCTVKSRI